MNYQKSIGDMITEATNRGGTNNNSGGGFGTVGSLGRGMNPLMVTPPPSSTLFVGDISILCNEEQLYELYQSFGKIEKLEVKKKENHIHINYAFIKYASYEIAAYALQETNGKLFFGRNLRVGWADDMPKRSSPSSSIPTSPSSFPRSVGEPGYNTNNNINRESVRSFTELSASKKGSTAQVHITYVTNNLETVVSELILREIFGTFGEIVDIAIKKSVMNPAQRIQSGYGFIHYPMTEEGINSAVAAIKDVNHAVIRNISFECTMSHGLKTYLLSRAHPSRGGTNHGVNSAEDAYFSNLPPHVKPAKSPINPAHLAPRPPVTPPASGFGRYPPPHSPTVVTAATSTYEYTGMRSDHLSGATSRRVEIPHTYDARPHLYDFSTNRAVSHQHPNDQTTVISGQRIDSDYFNSSFEGSQQSTDSKKSYFSF